MEENSVIKLNMQSPTATVIYAVQNDRLSRKIVAYLYDGSEAWTPPDSAIATIRYLKPDGTAGFYDVDENDNSAVDISGYRAVLTIAEQALTVPGDVYMQLNFYGTDGSKLTSFAWILRVQKSVLEDATIVSSDYYNVLTGIASQVAADAAAVSSAASQITIPLPISSGGTGATTKELAKKNLDYGTVAQQFVLGTSSRTNAWASIGCTVNNTNNERNGHRLTLWLYNNGFHVYDEQEEGTICNIAFPLSLSNGGTGATTAAGVWANLGGSSGTDYCKLPDGTLMCWGTTTFPDAAVGVQNVTVNFPVAFVSKPNVIPSWQDSSSINTYFGYCFALNSSTTTSSAVISAQRIKAGYAWYASWFAIGRWKA